MSEPRQTVAGAYLQIAAHEQLCAERYRGINEKLSWVLGGMAAMLLGLLGWALVQLYTLEPLRTEAARAGRVRPPATAAQPGPVFGRPPAPIVAAAPARYGSGRASGAARTWATARHW